MLSILVPPKINNIGVGSHVHVQQSKKHENESESDYPRNRRDARDWGGEPEQLNYGKIVKTFVSPQRANMLKNIVGEWEAAEMPNLFSPSR